MKKAAPLLLLLAVLVAGFPPAFAHSETIVGDIKIEGGWVNEPPLVNQLNGIELSITKVSTGEPIINAVAQLDIMAKKGAVTKPLDFQPTEEPGVYTAQILPTQTGQYEVVFRGTIAGQAVDNQIELENAEDSRLIEFPVRTDNNTIPTDLIEQLQSVIADLNAQVEQATSSAKEAVDSAQAATQAAAELKQSADRAYLFGMVGVGVGVAGIIIGVVALTRSKEPKIA